MAKAPPSFQFYPADFLMGTQHLDTLAIGTYLLLLCYQWAHKQLPADRATLARISKLSESDFDEVWQTIADKFVEIKGGGYSNERLESVREKAVALSEKRQEYGSKGGLAKASRLLKQNSSKGSMKSEDRSMKIEDRKLEAERVESCQRIAAQTSVIVLEYKKQHPRAKPGPKELDKIRDRLKEGFSVEELTTAISGCHASPFHSGQNETGRTHQGLELICRDSAHVNQFIELAGQVNAPVLSKISQTTAAAVKEFLSHDTPDYLKGPTNGKP